MENKSKAERIIPIITGAVVAVITLLTFLWGSGILRSNSSALPPSNTDVSVIVTALTFNSSSSEPRYAAA